MLHVNIRGWRSHCDELSAYLNLLEHKPTLVAINESFVNRSVLVVLPGYVLVGRRDRHCSDVNPHIDNLQSWGGILLFVAQEYDGAVVQVLESDTAERLWFILHCDVGPILVCIWYRPPAPSDISSISTLDSELSQLRNDVIGTAIIGDLNCHHARWLYHSAGVSTEGRALHRFCMENGFQEFVKQPTRQSYLLDLVLSDWVMLYPHVFCLQLLITILFWLVSIFHLMCFRVL